jgi:hypothetical protein
MGLVIHSGVFVKYKKHVQSLLETFFLGIINPRLLDAFFTHLGGDAYDLTSKSYFMGIKLVKKQFFAKIFYFSHFNVMPSQLRSS